MAERLRASHEQIGASPEAIKQRQEQLREQHESANKTSHESAKELESLQDKVERLAATAESTKQRQEQHTAEAPKRHVIHNANPVSHTEKQALKRAQKELKGPERQFSKVVHNPVVETISDVTGATVARPSGILFGASFSLIASIAVLMLVKYYGYEYNFFVALGAFVGGYIIGVIIEFIYKAFRHTSPGK